MLILVWCFFMILKRVDCVLVGVWLILFINMILVKIGFWWKLNLLVFILKIVVFRMLFGIRLGVNCIWLKLVFIKWVVRWVSKVLVIFGIFFIKMWLLVKIVVNIKLIVCFCFIIMEVIWFFSFCIFFEKRVKLVCGVFFLCILFIFFFIFFLFIKFIFYFFYSFFFLKKG